MKNGNLREKMSAINPIEHQSSYNLQERAKRGCVNHNLLEKSELYIEYRSLHTSIYIYMHTYIVGM